MGDRIERKRKGGGGLRLEFDDGRGQVNADDEFRQLLEAQKEKFRAKFKREFRPSDPLFFDPDLDVPALMPREKLPPEVAQVFEHAHIAGAMLYAQVKVGYFLSPMNYDVASEEEQRAWEAALHEFARLKGIR